MVCHMKTTLNISDVTMGELRREAALRALLRPRDKKTELPPLPEFRTGRVRVNIANRDALYEIMER